MIINIVSKKGVHKMTNMILRSPFFTAIILFSLASYSGPALAVDVQFSAQVEEVYSDNITLVPNDEAKADFVTRIAPSVQLDYLANSAEVTAEYTYEILRYASETDFDQEYHQLNALGGIDIIGKTLRMQGQTIYTQVNVDPRAPAQTSNIAAGGNRTDASNWQLGPRYQQEMFGADVSAFYDYGRIEFDDPNSQDIESNRYGASVSNAEITSSRTTYEAVWNYWKLDYQVSGEIEDQTLYLQLRRELSDALDVFALGGADSDLFDRGESSLSETRWEVGFDYTGFDNYVSASFGDRYFGSVYRVSAGRQVSAWNYGLSYSEEPGTSESFFLGEQATPDPGEPPPDAGLDTPGLGQPFIRKRTDATINWEGYASRLLVRGWLEKRDQSDPEDFENPNDGIISDNEKSKGLAAAYEWDLGAKTGAVFRTGWDKREFDDLDPLGGPSIKSDIETFRVGAEIIYELGLKTSVTGGAGYRDSSGSDGNNNFDEIYIAVMLTRIF